MTPREAVLDHYASCDTCDAGDWCEIADRLEAAEVGQRATTSPPAAVEAPAVRAPSTGAHGGAPVEGATTRLCSVCLQRGTGHNARTCPQRGVTVREAVALDSVGICGKYHDPTKPLRCHRTAGHELTDGKRVSTPAGASPETADGEHLAGQHRPSPIPSRPGNLWVATQRTALRPKATEGTARAGLDHIEALGPWSTCVAGDPYCPCVSGVGHGVP